MTVTSDKPFRCEKCGLGFSMKFNMTRHFAFKHTNHESKYMKHIKKDGRYVCRCCGKTYSHPSDLKRHLRTSHTEQQLRSAKVEREQAITYIRKHKKHQQPPTPLQI